MNLGTDFAFCIVGKERPQEAKVKLYKLVS